MRFRIFAALRDGISSLVTYLVLPFLGWWLAERALAPAVEASILSSFVSEPARAAYLAASGVQIVLSALLAGRLPPVPKRFTVRPGLLHWRLIALETILVLGPYCDHRGTLVFGDSAPLRWLGVILYASGTSLALWAGYLRSWAVARMDQSPYEPVLLVDGPFRQLRYPGYLGLLLFSLGAALLFRSWFGLGAFCLMLNFIVMRINEEDHSARVKFGIRWTAYSRHSWRLVPFIY